jgi:hypothetical protein
MLPVDALGVVTVADGAGVAAGAGGLDWANAVTITTDDSSPPSKRLERMSITPVGVQRCLSNVLRRIFVPYRNAACAP